MNNGSLVRTHKECKKWTEKKTTDDRKDNKSKCNRDKIGCCILYRMGRSVEVTD